MRYRFLILSAILLNSVSASLAQSLPSDSLIYDFMNAVICRDDSSVFNLNEDAETGFIFSDTSSILQDSGRFSDADFVYIRKQIAGMADFTWNADSLCGAQVIPSRTIKRIFKNKRGWDKFRNRYGECLSSYSKPIFNLDHTICIVQLGTQCDWLLGQGGTYVFKQINGNWVEIDRYGMWIS